MAFAAIIDVRGSTNPGFLEGRAWCGHSHRSEEAAARCAGRYIRAGVPATRVRVARSYEPAILARVP